MTKKNFDEKISDSKDGFMKEYWTENFHLALDEIGSEKAKAIVEAMDDADICFRVNARKFQQDYIADYIEYLWGISKIAYWKHVKTTLDVEEGFLWSDNMSHSEKLCNNPIPDDVFEAVLNFAVNCTEEIDMEIMGDIVKSQAESFDRMKDIKKYLSLLEKNKKEEATNRINKMLDGTLSSN